MNDDWYDEQHKREEELYYNEIDLKHIMEDEEQTGSRGKGDAGSLIIWLIAIVIVAYAILNMIGKI